MLKAKGIQFYIDNYSLIVLAISLGNIFFFSLPFDPRISYVMAFFICAVFSYVVWRETEFRYIAFIILTLSISFIFCAVRVESVDTNRITKNYEDIWLKGIVYEVSLKEKDTKIILKDIQGALSLDKVRISLRGDYTGFKIGDTISVRANLLQIPGPVTPNGFDFRFYSFFKGIQAIGYATSRPKLIKKNSHGSVTEKIENIRIYVASRIRNILSKSEAEIAAGMLVGVASAIPEKDFSVIRDSGIAHIIAISGMHIVAVVTIIFFISKWILMRFHWLMVRMDVKKIAAIISIIFTYIYLLLAGSPVSAERAFLMSALVLFGIVIGREITPKRSIAIAAIVILTLMPETIISAGLQMSFAACYSLICIYEYLSNKLVIRIKIIDYAVRVTVSSLIAGMAVAPFVAYHFHQFSTYSILTNLIAVPLSDFIIMPLLMLALVAVPFGVDYPIFKLAGYAIYLMLEYARFISSLPFASIFINPFPAWAILLYGVCGYIICTSVGRYKHICWLGIILSLLSNFNYVKPSLLVEGDGKVFAIKHDGEYYVSSRSVAKFTSEVWKDYLGINNFNHIREIGCNEYFCFKEGVVITRGIEPNEKECSAAKLIINIGDKTLSCTNNVLNLVKGIGNLFISNGETLKLIRSYNMDNKRRWD